MVKKILAIYYTQTGQLSDIVGSFMQPFIQQGHHVEMVRATSVKDFSFPWSSDSFFDAMPESVLCIPVELAPFSIKEEKYDLVVFAYQPWFLSPSIPATSILKHPQVKKVIANTPVITLIGARNMWLNSQEKIKKLLAESNASLVGNVVLTDKHNNLASAVTILYWMLSGKKDKMWGVFPKPGVADEDIRNVPSFAAFALPFLETGNWLGFQQQIVNAGGIEVKTNLLFIESRAGKLFSIWANFVHGSKNRHFRLALFKYYLIIALFIVAPIVLAVYMIIFKPFLTNSIRKRKDYYLGININ